MLPEREQDNTTLLLDEDMAELAQQDTTQTEPMSFVGFTGNTRLSTSFGDVPAQLLRVNDTLRTSAGSYARIRRIDKVHLDQDFLSYHPEAQPIFVRAGAFGRDAPAKNASFAPQQKVMPKGAQGMKKMMTALDLTVYPHVYRMPVVPLVYYVLHCDQPAEVRAEGIWAQV